MRLSLQRLDALMSVDDWKQLSDNLETIVNSFGRGKAGNGSVLLLS